jgi:hypothetical protein
VAPIVEMKKNPLNQFLLAKSFLTLSLKCK